jgi:thiamine pyrophosphate-dependent acetolactate synthase large subunit-like protein
MANLDNADNNRGNVSSEEIPVVATIANFLAGMDFPKTKDQIVEYAQKNPTGNENKARQTQPQQESQSYDHEQIISVLRKLPDREYQNMTDLSTALNEVKA